MIVYQAPFRFVEDQGQGHGVVLDFPGIIACGPDLNAMRSRLASALAEVAETFFLRGKPLPQRYAAVTDPETNVEEPIRLRAAS